MPKNSLARKIVHHFFGLLDRAFVLRAIRMVFGYRGAIVLMYHDIPGKEFEQQLEFLKRNFDIIPVEELVKGLEVRGSMQGKCVLTFDDGYKSFHSDVFPVIKKHSVPVTVFLIAGAIGKKFNEKNLMNWTEILELQETGLVSFGSHSLSHPHLNKLSRAQLDRELSESKKALEKKLGKKIEFFAAPYGEYSANHLNAFSKAGYRAALTVVEGDNIAGGNLLELKRITVEKLHKPTHIYFTTSGLNRFFQKPGLLKKI